MAPKSGLSAYLGYAAESTYGTFATPNRFLRFADEDFDAKQEYDEDEELAAGLLGLEEGMSTQTTTSVDGSVTLTPASKGFGGLLNLLNGDTPTSTGGGAAKTWNFPFGLTAPDGKSITAQVGIPDLGGTPRPKNSLGMVVQSVEFSIEIGKSLKSKWMFVGRDQEHTSPLASPVFATGFERFGYKGSNVTIDGAAVTGKVRTVNLKLDIPRETGRYGLDGTGLADEPVSNGKYKASGSMQIEFNGLAQVNAFRNSSRRAMKWENKGKVDIQSGIKPELTFDMAAIITKGGVPKVAGPGIVLLDVPFDAYLTGSSPLVAIKYVTSDTAL